MNTRRIFKLLLLVSYVSLTSACGTFEVGIEPTPVVQITRASVEVTSTVSPIPAPTSGLADIPGTVDATPTAVAPSTVPQVNTIYFGTVEDSPVVFVRNVNDQWSHASDSYLGRAVNVVGHPLYLFDFRKLEYPIPVFSSDQETDIYGFTIDRNGQWVYVALLQRNSPTESKYIESIIKFDPARRTNQDVWTMEIGGNKYPGFTGGAYIEQAEDHFIVLKLFDCYACEPGPLQSILVLNTETGREKFLGTVGDVTLDLRANTVLYRNLNPFQEKCEPGPIPGCDTGYTTVYAPSGEVITEQLP